MARGVRCSSLNMIGGAGAEGVQGVGDNGMDR